MWCRAGDEEGYHALPGTDEEQGKGPPSSQGEAEAYREEVTPSLLASPKAALLAVLLNRTHLNCMQTDLSYPHKVCLSV